jgi:hypothetical protein
VVLGTAQNLTWYLAAWLLIGGGMGAGLYDAAFATLGSIYARESRSAITSVTLFGGFASTVCGRSVVSLPHTWGGGALVSATQCSI